METTDEDYKRNPWNTLSSDVKYDNPWIRVVEHQIINPRGNPGIYGTVSFKHIAIGILPLDEEGCTWLVGQYRYPLGRYSWEVPAGGGKLDVDPEETAKRELLEETGMTARRWQKILEMDLSNSITDERAIAFIATDLSFGKACPEDDEVLTIRRLPLDEAYAMVVEGEIADSITVAVVLRARLLIHESRLSIL